MAASRVCANRGHNLIIIIIIMFATFFVVYFVYDSYTINNNKLYYV